MPKATIALAPAMKPVSAEMRYAAREVISSGLPTLPSGCFVVHFRDCGCPPRAPREVVREDQGKATGDKLTHPSMLLRMQQNRLHPHTISVVTVLKNPF